MNTKISHQKKSKTVTRDRCNGTPLIIFLKVYAYFLWCLCKNNSNTSQLDLHPRKLNNKNVRTQPSWSVSLGCLLKLHAYILMLGVLWQWSKMHAPLFFMSVSRFYYLRDVERLQPIVASASWRPN